MAGDLADSYVTVFETPERAAEKLFPAVRRGIEKSTRNDSFDDVEKTVHIHCLLAETKPAALEPCLPWRLTLLSIVFAQDISDPRYLQLHGDLVSTRCLENHFVITTDPEDLLDVAERYVDSGFDHIVFQSSSPDQEAFCEAVSDVVMPSFS